MTDTVMLEASLFQLKSAAAAIEDPMFKMQLQLTLDVLTNAVAGAMQSLNPATMNDVDFALNDVIGTVGELNAVDAAAIQPALDMMKADVESLKQATTLPAAVVEGVREFQLKLKTRRTAIERQTYRAEGTEPAPLPFPPEDLQKEGIALRKALAQAGFVTPALDDFIADASSLVFASIGDIVDELDVIIG
jgi:hypothetical protein